MYIERVEIYGFKSFARKTELVFGPGLCVVMGPNGVGKSNILDAIRWAVGEQKLSLLRSSLLEDVIFDGSAGQKPANFAEVSVQFAEAEGLLPYDPKADRIKITRRVYRDGDSKFFINNVPMRLKDIRGILATVGLGDVGYAVLNEGMINKIIGGSTEDRRMLFEQAAGIAKYKSDKRATELKLKATQADLVRIEDIIRELSEQEAILRRQVHRYRRYKKLRGEIAELETKLYGSKLAALTAEVKQLQQALAGQKDLYEKISGELAEVSSEIQKLVAQRRELETRRDRIFQQRNKISSEIGAREQEIAVLEERIRHARETIANYSENSAQLSRTIRKGREDIKNAEQLKQLAQKKIGEVEAEIKKIEGEIDQLSQKALNKRRELKEFEQDYENLRRRIGELDRNIAFARQENKKLAERLAEYERQIAEREKNIAEIKKSLREYEQKLAELEGKREKFAADREKLSAEISELNEKIAQLRGQIVKYQNERAQTGGRIEELKRIVASGKDIGKNIAQISRQVEKYGILGIVADMVEIEPEYSRAAEQIMGERVKFFVVET
ncbi:AAA family ATPase, partial [bacterium]|nr:AAA family ATPase [bacterium]